MCVALMMQKKTKNFKQTNVIETNLNKKYQNNDFLSRIWKKLKLKEK